MEHVKTLSPDIFGIQPKSMKSYFVHSSISYFNIVDDKDISIGIFCLAQGASLKLHDHPNMLVLSKILHGAVHSRSMDLVDRSVQFELPKMLFQEDDPVVVGTKLEATVAFDGVLKKEDISYLNPEMKNVHSFKALEDTAILDILIPNYDDENRFCNFYLEVNEENEEIKLDEIINHKAKLSSSSNGIKEESDIKEEEVTEKYKKPGEKTTVMFILPPFDMHVKLLEYKGEPYEGLPEKS